MVVKSTNQKKVIDREKLFGIDTHGVFFNIILIVLCFLFLGAVHLFVNQPISGDEPAYLLMDYSLVHYRNLNLSKSYDKKDYLSFAPGYNSVQGSPSPGTKAPTKYYSQHGIGLPIFLSPGFGIPPLLFSSVKSAARSGAVIEMLLLATGVVVLTWTWTKQVTNNRRIAYIASALLSGSYFFSGLAGYIYPDMLISALVLVALIMIERYYSTMLFQIILGLVLGFLVLVHIKTLDLILPMLAILSYRLWKSKRKIPWSTFLTVAIFVAYYFITYHQWFGIWGIATGNGANGSQFGDNPLMSISAMMFDSFRGFIIYNPVMILILLGLPIWFKYKRESLNITLLATLPSIIVLSLFFQWNGGDAPVGRYIIDFLPSYIPALAFAVAALKKPWQKVVVSLLAVVTLAITIDATVKKFPLVDPGLVANKMRSPIFVQIQQHTNLALDRFIPMTSQYNFLRTAFIDKHGLLKTICWWLVVLVFFVYGIYLANGHKRGKLKTEQ